ncbi:MAG: HlyD family type I secretion periplasmic adaptor subunit [Xanthobacteraceae bacterium]|nr:HlyD family type I secretion periplasmic adaptor subunit [Xanthobacteraceae bacterium]
MMSASLSRLLAFDPGHAREREFLPAALEVTETPPNPLGRLIALVLGLVALAGLGWAVIGKVDIVAVASGKIISHMRTQVVQPFETASVKAVLVSPGQRVGVGDPLIELDKTAALAERDRARNDLVAAQLDDMRLSAFLDGAAAAPFEAVEAATPLDRARAQAQLTAQVAMRASQLSGLAQDRLQHVADREALKQTAVKVEQTLPIVAERASIRAKAMELGNTSVLAGLESQQLLVETRAELEITRAKIASLDAAIAGLDDKVVATTAEIRTTAMGDLGKARERVRAAEEALAKATRRADLQTLRSPISGTVQQLHIATIGAVVTPAQQLLSVVPDDDRIEVEAVLDNRDVGFVAVGQRVELKVDAFPFTRYGLLGGTVKSVDRDAEAAPVGQSSVQGTERLADETDHVEGSERLRYTVHIAVEPGSFDVDGRAAVLLPGMSVKAEILTGKRRIIDFLLAPLREHMHDAMRER